MNSASMRKLEQTQSLKTMSTRVSASSSCKLASNNEASGVAHHVHDHSWSAEKEKIFLGPYQYICDQPGKGVREQFIAAFNEWLRIPEKSLRIISKVVGMLHMASLL